MRWANLGAIDKLRKETKRAWCGRDGMSSRRILRIEATSRWHNAGREALCLSIKDAARHLKPSAANCIQKNISGLVALD